MRSDAAAGPGLEPRSLPPLQLLGPIGMLGQDLASSLTSVPGQPWELKLDTLLGPSLGTSLAHLPETGVRTKRAGS